MKKCKKCNRIHQTPLDVKQLSETEKKKLRQIPCHIFRDGYMGSILTKEFHYEYYSPIVEKKLIIQIKKKEEPEEEEGSYESSEYQIQESDWEAFEEENDY